MDRKLSWLPKYFRIAGCIFAAAILSSVPAQSQNATDGPYRRQDEKVLLFNELDYKKGQNTNGPNSCIWPLILDRDGLTQKPDADNDINRSQSVLLNRVNDIYDNSRIREPLAVPILYNPPSKNAFASSVLTHNYIVYYTIRRIEYFKKLRVAPLVNANSEIGAATSNAAPPSKGPSALQSASSTGSAEADSGGGPAASNKNLPQPQGIEVSTWFFEVHDFFHANIAAAFAFSSLKDQSIAKQASPQNCTGSTTTPDSNCFIPILNANDRQQHVMIAFDYYLQAQDSFPRDKYSRSWLCRAHPLQCFGPMGGISLTNANSYFLGAFFEPVIGIQVAGGANFGSETTLAKSYQFGIPAEVSGDFPTYQRRATGWFLGAGFDFGIFRQIFGKVTGIGTAKSSGS